MHARVALSALWFAVFAAVALVPRAHAGAWSLAPGEHYSEMRAGWFSSDFYYNHNGKKRDLFGGGLWEERSLTSYTELGWKKRVSFILGIPAVSVTRRFGAQMGDRTVPTATGLGDAQIGFRWRFANGRTGAALQLDWKAPLGYQRERYLTHADSVASGGAGGDSIDFNRARHFGSPVLGDGQQDVTLSLHLGWTVGKRAFLQGSGGYRYRFEDPEDQIVSSADVGVWLTRGLMVAGRYMGEGVTNVNDLFTDLGPRPEDTVRPNQNFVRHRVGPALIYRVDDRMDVFISSLHTFSAKNALHTDEIFVGVAFRHTALNRLQGFLGNRTSP